KLVLDEVAHVGDRFIRNPQTVSSHISNETDRSRVVDLDSFVQFLRDGHGLLARETQPYRGLLLKRARLEGRAGLLQFLGDFKIADAKRRSRERIANGACLGLRLGGKLLALPFRKLGRKSI